jgi:hypothetical protein
VVEREGDLGGVLVVSLQRTRRGSGK